MIKRGAPENASATVALTDADPEQGGHVIADIRLSPEGISSAPIRNGWRSWPPGKAVSATTVPATASLSGQAASRRRRPLRVHPARAVARHLENGAALAGRAHQSALPRFHAVDPGIGAAEVPAPASFTRPFVEEISVLQRERSFDHPSWLIGLAGLVVLACSLALIAAMASGAARVNDRYLAAGSTPDQKATVEP